MTWPVLTHKAKRTGQPGNGTGRWVLAVAVVMAVVGAALLLGGMIRLRPAYLNRERTGEGIFFVEVAYLLVFGSVVTLIAASLFAAATHWLARAAARGAGVAAVLLVAVVALCTAVTIGVEGHSGCLLGC